jgi:transposase
MAPSLQDWLPEDHLARFVAEVAEGLDLSAIYRVYERGDGRGLAAYHPLMLTRLLVYGYATGLTSSRRIQQATYDDVAFRYLAADQHPDHDTIAHFRQQHLDALGNVFVDVLRLCQRAGLIKLGHVAIDGTKLKANASKHQSMRYEKLSEQEQRLTKLVEDLLAEAERVDQEEDLRYGKGQREHALPPELATSAARLERLRQAKRELEEEARQAAEAAQREAQPHKRRAGRPNKNDPPAELDEAQRRVLNRRAKRAAQRAETPTRHYNFTDPDSRMMWDNGVKTTVQGFNAQVAVDADAQIIVAADVTQQTTDHDQLAPMVEQVRKQTGETPECVMADAGYWHTAQLLDERMNGVELLVPPDGLQKRRRFTSPLAESMREKLKQTAHKAIYALRQSTVEPVFAHLQEGRGFRRFRLRGLAQVRSEWRLICLTHNVLKLFRHKAALARA